MAKVTVTEQELAQALGNAQVAKRVFDQIKKRRQKKAQIEKAAALPKVGVAVYREYLSQHPQVGHKFKKWVETYKVGKEDAKETTDSAD